MKRLLITFAAVMALLVVGTPAASASITTSDCLNHTYQQNSTHDRTICTAINDRQFPFVDGAQIEALLQWDRAPFHQGTETIRIQADYILLQKQTNDGWKVANESGGNPARVDLAGWQCGNNPQNNCSHEFENMEISTKWVEIGCHTSQGRDGPGFYRSQSRYRIQWMDINNPNNVGPWIVNTTPSRYHESECN